jgi:hypothetical protein
MPSIRVVEVSLDAAVKLLRQELKREFPGTKFSVTRDRGTAYGYVSVRWQDGPPMREVDAICAGYAGTRYSCAEDLEHEITHVAADGAGAPMQVRYRTRGILCSRTLSPAWWAMYIRLMLELNEHAAVAGPYSAEELLAMGDEALVEAATCTRLGGDWLSGLAWRASEHQEAVR